MAHPWSIDIVAKDSLFDGVAALCREEIKANKYMGKMQPQGSSPSVVPLVFEHFGCWGERALKQCSRQYRLYHHFDGWDKEGTFGEWKTAIIDCWEQKWTAYHR